MFGKFKKGFYHSCLNTDRYDKHSFKRLYDISPKLQNIEEEGEKVLPGFINFLGDAWSSLYKTDPQPNPEASERALNHKPLIDRLMQSKEYEEFKKHTVLDDFSAAIGSISLGENTVEYIKIKQQEDEKIKEQMKKQKELQKKMQANEKAIEKREEKGQGPTKTQQKKKKSLEEELQQLQQQITQQLANGMDIKKIVQQAGEEAKEAKDGLEDLLAGPAAGSGKGEMQKIPLSTQLELAQLLKKHPEIKKVAEWAGRFKKIARKKQKSKNIESVERQGITLGNDLELLLPTELAQYNNPNTKLYFLKKFVEKQTMQYDPKGKEAAGKGPIVFCIDQSGSMRDIKEQAAGFALAIAMIARSQKRDFAYIPFDGVAGQILFFSKGKLDTSSIIKIATEFMGGGTNFMIPLTRAMDIIEQKSNFKNADIVFVTDGKANVDDAFIKQYQQKKKQLCFQCHSIKIKEHSYAELEKFSDEIFHADNLLQAAENSGAFSV